MKSDKQRITETIIGLRAHLKIAITGLESLEEQIEELDLN